ncbi:MAG TPA: hypothetical protein VK927_05485, partial [Adhaeribacter sp.]|nr:hypothetical protein [Adhaeribacter sp.]
MALRKFILGLLGLSCLIFSCPGVSAQQLQGANWFFGAEVFLDFKNQPPVLGIRAPQGNFTFGVATISDAKGDLLFFSSTGNIF